MANVPQQEGFTYEFRVLNLTDSDFDLLTDKIFERVPNELVSIAAVRHPVAKGFNLWKVKISTDGVDTALVIQTIINDLKGE